MGFLGLFSSDARRREQQLEKWELEKQFLQDKHEAKLRYEERRKDVEFLQIQKKAELENIKLDYEIRKHQQLIEEDFGEEIDEAEPQEDKLLSNIFSQIMSNQNKQQSLDTFNAPGLANDFQNSPVADSQMSDREINNLIDNVDKKYIDMARKMPNSVIKSFIKKQYPDIDEQTINRAITILRSRS